MPHLPWQWPTRQMRLKRFCSVNAPWDCNLCKIRVTEEPLNIKLCQNDIVGHAVQIGNGANEGHAKEHKTETTTSNISGSRKRKN